MGVLDGKNYNVKAPTAIDMQNAYYNGWLHCTFVTGTLLFGVDGTIYGLAITLLAVGMMGTLVTDYK